MEAIDRLFKHMERHYGSQFADKWMGVATSDMMEHWATELSGFTLGAIAAALKDLDNYAFPPSVPEFKTLCKAHQPKFEAPKTERIEVDPAIAGQAIKAIKGFTEKMADEPTDYKKWAREIVELWDQNKYNLLVGYKIACKALDINPKLRVSSRKECQYAD